MIMSAMLVLHQKIILKDLWNINIIIIVETLAVLLGIMDKNKKFGDVWIEPIEVVDESNRYETEMYWIQNLDGVINYNNGSYDKATYNLDYQYQNKIRLCERIKCSCGKFISRKNISTHRKNVSHFTRLHQLRNKTRKD